MNEYEVKFERWNLLTRRHEVQYEYIDADTAQEARDRIRWLYGEHVDFLSVEKFTG